MTYALVREQPPGPPPVTACVLTIDSLWHLRLLRSAINSADTTDGAAALPAPPPLTHSVVCDWRITQRSLLAALDAAIREWEGEP
jgi:hypothetical protein